MALYKLLQSLAVQPQDNRIPAFSLKIDFAEGSLARNCFAPENSNALWALIGDTIFLEIRPFFEIERQDADLKLQGCGEGQLFRLSQDTHKHTINLIGLARLDDGNMDLVQVWDMRWELTYFLPHVAFFLLRPWYTLEPAACSRDRFVNTFRFRSLFQSLVCRMGIAEKWLPSPPDGKVY